MSRQQRKDIALQVIGHKTSVTSIANQHGVSRKFVYQQKAVTMDAVDHAFEATSPADDEVLFYLPVTKAWIAQLVLYGRVSFRGIQQVLKDGFDYELSVGSIHNIADRAKSAAARVNAHQDLSSVKQAAHDEIFHHNKPVLAGVDIPSLYCYLLSEEDQRDTDTWAIHFMDLQQQGWKPERAIGDDGNGLRAAHEMIFPEIPFDYDNFHLSKLLIETRRYFRNCYKSSLTSLILTADQMEKAKLNGNACQHSRALGEARKQENIMKHLSDTVDTLVSWIEHDVLNKMGPALSVRRELYDYIVDEFTQLEKIHPHRLKKLCVTLKDKRETALAYCDALEEKFKVIAQTHHCSVEIIWKVCELLRCDYGGDAYSIRSLPLEDILGDHYEEVEDAVILALESTERTSSMIENLNSRLRLCFNMRREIGHGYLDLLRFFLNHKPFQRSSKPHRVGKSPAEILSGKAHPHWLALLGYTPFHRAT
jgi:hypothetical protein